MIRKFFVQSFALSILALLWGCATPAEAPRATLRTSATFDAPKDRVWPLLVSGMGLDYPVRVIEKESGLISTDWVTLPAGYNNMNAQRRVSPPGGFLATWNGLRMNMKVVAVETSPGKTLVTINCHYEAFENNVHKTWLVAESNGSIENAILIKTEESLKHAAPSALVAPATAAVAPSTLSPSDALLQLKKLLDAGAITQAEFDAKKKVLLEKL